MLSKLKSELYMSSHPLWEHGGHEPPPVRDPPKGVSRRVEQMLLAMNEKLSYEETYTSERGGESRAAALLK